MNTMRNDHEVISSSDGEAPVNQVEQKNKFRKMKEREEIPFKKTPWEIKLYPMESNFLTRKR